MAAAADRRCLHCGAVSTPLWRRSPLGPKTLCNACGVRMKKGRLAFRNGTFVPVESPASIAKRRRAAAAAAVVAAAATSHPLVATPARQRRVSAPPAAPAVTATTITTSGRVPQSLSSKPKRKRAPPKHLVDAISAAFPALAPSHPESSSAASVPFAPDPPISMSTTTCPEEPVAPAAREEPEGQSPDECRMEMEMVNDVEDDGARTMEQAHAYGGCTMTTVPGGEVCWCWYWRQAGGVGSPQCGLDSLVAAIEYIEG